MADEFDDVLSFQENSSQTLRNFVHAYKSKVPISLHNICPVMTNWICKKGTPNMKHKLQHINHMAVMKLELGLYNKY